MEEATSSGNNNVESQHSDQQGQNGLSETYVPDEPVNESDRSTVRLQPKKQRAFFKRKWSLLSGGDGTGSTSSAATRVDSNSLNYAPLPGWCFVFKYAVINYLYNINK